MDYSCGICLGLLTNPVELECHHAFCREHLQQWAAHGHRLTCPNCRRDLPSEIPPVSARLLKLIEAFRPTLHRRTALDPSSVQVSGSVLGRGAFATVYAGVFEGKDVAVKKALVSSAAQAKAVENEIKMAGLLGWPRIPILSRYSDPSWIPMRSQ
eukprot:RCo004063